MKNRIAWFILLLVATLSWQSAFAAENDRGSSRPRNPEAPEFKVDANWPKPLPNKWLLGQVAGIAVDRQDHIWIIQRPRTLTVDEAGADQVPPRSECCHAAPSVMAFDREGNLLLAWGGPADPNFLSTRCVAQRGCEWPTNEHGIFVDHENNVWIGGNGTDNNQVLKFSRDGTFLLQIGQAGRTGGNLDTNGSANGTPLLGQPADIEVDPETNLAYISDGYLNHRVVVVNGSTGKFVRYWGAYGHVPDNSVPGPYDPAAPLDQQFRSPVHCVKIARDGLVYVCDRLNNRIQVFQKDGTYVKEFFVDTNTLGNGSAWDVDLSPDRRQTWLYNPDGENNKVWIFNRVSGQVADTFGRNGRYAGEFHWVHNLAVDSQGNIYTAEVDTGKRAQKFSPDRRSRERDRDR
ncbi:MAG: hypothetical protein ACRYGK_12160 [Janthinobacterium lividum]